MYIYAGKLNWSKYSVGEVFVVILPDGPVRVGDTIYFFSQWTVDSQGNKSVNWFDKKVIETVSKTADGQDTFTLAHRWYSYNVVSNQNYKSLTITMSNPVGGKQDSTVDLVYQPKGQVSDAARVWTGKFDWEGQKDPKSNATDEPILFVVPEGFGTDKPVFAFWQWTDDGNGNKKVPAFQITKQQNVEKEDKGVLFSFQDTLAYKGVWRKENEKLSLEIGKVGDTYYKPSVSYDLAAVIESHSEDLVPPSTPAGSRELELRYPQPEPALSRIQTPMPFPSTLLDTLTQTASFLDQAGYVAKYVLDQYQGLDKSYHVSKQQIVALNVEVEDWIAKVRDLTNDNKAEKGKVTDLEKQLKDARDAAEQKEKDLTQQIQDLQKTIAGDRDHDAADHKALVEAHEMIKKEQEAKNALQKQIVTLQITLAAADARIKQLTAQISDLTAQLSEAKSQLEVEREHNEELQKSNTDLKQQLAKAEADLAATQKTLARTQEDLEQAKSDCDDKDQIIEGLEKGLVAMKKDRDSKKKAFDELKKSTDAIIQDLEAKLAAASGGGPSWQPPSTGLYPYDQYTPTEMRTSINKNESKSSWARMSPWVGNMSNRGIFFSSLDWTDKPKRLKTLGIYANADWVEGFEVKWEDNSSCHWGQQSGQPQYTLTQTKEKPIVAVNVVTDDVSCRVPYQPVANMTFFGFDKDAGYQQVGEFIAGHRSNSWNKAIAKTSFAPALDGSWALAGIYGYVDGSMDAVGFIWAKNDF